MISNDGDIYWTDCHPPMGTKLYAATIEQPPFAGLVKVLTEAVEYLDSNYLNTIRAGSKLHISMRCALAALNSKQAKP